MKAEQVVSLIKSLGWAIAVVVVVLFGPWDRLLPAPAPGPGPGPSPTPVVSSYEDFRQIVLPASAEQKKQLSDFLSALSDQFSRLDGSIDGEAIRDFLKSADTYRFKGTDLIGAFPGYTQVTNAYIEQAVGIESRDFGPSDFQKLAALYAGLSKACE